MERYLLCWNYHKQMKKNHNLWWPVLATCPTQVHWHVKQSYKEYWRVKITITNLNFVKNYSMWNLVVLHPNLKNVTQVFSFNYQPLNSYANISK